MDKDRSHTTERILNLTLEIIYLLTGEVYTVVKNTSGDHKTLCSHPRVSGGLSRTQSPIPVPPPHSVIHERHTDQKILELTNKIIQLLTGEEWEYIDRGEENHSVPQEDQGEDLTNIKAESLGEEETYATDINAEDTEGETKVYGTDLKVENIKEEETYVRGDQQCKEEEIPTGISIADGHSIRNSSEEHLHLSPDGGTEDNDITQDYPEEKPITPIIHPVTHSADTTSNPSNHGDCSPDTSAIGDSVTVSTVDTILPSSIDDKCIQSTKLISNQSTMTGEKPITCSECGKCFTRKSSLVVHERSHTGDRLFPCSECGKCFTQKSAFITHKRSHTGERPFPCSECEKRFTRKSSLIKHERTHTGERPFPCSECGKCFTQMSNLVIHERCHTGEKPFPCSECGKCFTRKSSLIKHERAHTGERPFPCSVCGKCFTQKLILVTHQRSHIGEKDYTKNISLNLKNESKKAISMRVIVPVPLSQRGRGHYSMLFLVPKPNGSSRPIHNLKSLNKFVRVCKFYMETLHSIVLALEHKDYMVSLDIQNAYLHIAIAKSHQQYLRFAIGNLHYQFQALPFGLTTVPRIFTKVMAAMTAFLRRQGIRILPYLDDLLILANSTEVLLRHLELIVQFLHAHGWLINWKKSSLVPAQSMGEPEFVEFTEEVSATVTQMMQRSQYSEAEGQVQNQLSSGLEPAEISKMAPLQPVQMTEGSALQVPFTKGAKSLSTGPITTLEEMSMEELIAECQLRGIPFQFCTRREILQLILQDQRDPTKAFTDYRTWIIHLGPGMSVWEQLECLEECFIVAEEEGEGTVPPTPLPSAEQEQVVEIIVEASVVKTLTGTPPATKRTDWRGRRLSRRRCAQKELQPTQSPDLKPIEHLWDELEQRLRARPSPPTPDLINALQNEWVQIPTETLQDLVESLSRRVVAVIDASAAGERRSVGPGAPGGVGVYRGNKDLFEGTMENHWPLTSPDGSRYRNTPDACLHPLYSLDRTQGNHRIPQEDQCEDLINIKLEDIEGEEKMYLTDRKAEDIDGGEEEMYLNIIKVEDTEGEEEMYVTDTKAEDLDGEEEMYVNAMKVQDTEGEEETYVRGDQQCKEEEIPTDITTADVCNRRNIWQEHLLLSPDCDIEDNITRDSPAETPITSVIHPGLHSTDLSSDPTYHEECSARVDTKCFIQDTKPITHQPAKTFPCSECGKCFTQKSYLVIHERSHTGEKPFPCSECGKCFTQKSSLVLHEKIHTGEKPFPCSECGRCFIQKSDLVKHERTHTGEKPFSCSECGKSYAQRSDLVKHERSHTGEKPFRCSECGKCYAEKSYLVVHMRSHTGEKLFSCSHCGKCFIRKSHFVIHERHHTGEKPFSCSACGKCFVQKSDLVTHERSHTGEKPFPCSECGKCYAQKSHLVIHMRSHTGEKPFPCSECGRCFSQKSHVVTHERSHRGERPFSCSVCGKSYGQKTDLVIHERTHTGERPFPCSTCGKCFTQKSHLVIHERTHTGERPFSCSECGKCFTQKSYLVKHWSSHTGERDGIMLSSLFV
ncbi:uncharacterized protein LOC134984009 [Pseudophryne corroboree]|uniref:uncharacterized protein LOC134984009 n=1 Tax=Pseudophryne corroboree TaxID=495146 RepID=UPI003081E1AE